MSAPRLLVVVAHPDDETFGCGGLLLHAREVGFETHVTCATPGDAGADRLGRSGPELGAVRAEELRRAAALLGVTGVELLGFADSGMSGDPPATSLEAAPFEDLVATVAGTVSRVEPDVVVTLDASDGHRDHVRVRDATLEAVRRTGVREAYLSCLAASLMRRWTDHMRVDQPDREHLALEEPALGTPDELISTLVDVRRHREQLARAMAEHASQDSPYDALPSALRDAFLDTARARRVRPAWDGSVVGTSLRPATAAVRG